MGWIDYVKNRVGLRTSDSGAVYSVQPHSDDVLNCQRSRQWSLLTGVCLCLALSSCNSPGLYGRVEKLNRSSLVGYALNTPDPSSKNPPNGQRLIVSWVLAPFQVIKGHDYKLYAQVVTLQGAAENYEVPINYAIGHWELEIPREKMKLGGAVASYRLEIKQGDRSVRVFEHKLYRPFIQIEELPEEEELLQL